MPQYFYIAKSTEGEKAEGSAEAENELQLARILRGQGLLLISAQEKGRFKKKKEIRLSFLDRVSLVEKMMFCRNLKVMISAGMALPKSLMILSNQVKSKRFKEALLGIRDEIIQGKAFSAALSLYPDIFPELFSSMVKAGEESGRLEEVLDILSRQMERMYELKSKIMGAMMYPAVVILAMMGIGALMLIMVIPKMAATFRELEVPLPATTQFVIFLGETLAARWYLVLGGIILLPFLLSRIAKTRTGKKIIDTITLKVPIVSSILKKTNSAYTTRILSSLISAGVPITRSLEILSETLGNVYYKEAMQKASEQIRKGVKLSDVLTEYENIYPSIVIQMVAVGEETGMTSDILEKLAGFFEEEVANATKNLASVIEPLVMLVIGGAVGFFSIAMIQPIYSMLGAMK